MRIRISKEGIPWAMAAGRAMLGPVLIAGERYGWNGLALAWLVVSALVSDIFDGVMARRWRCDTAGVRLFDTMADTVFYGCVAIALWIGLPQVWHGNGGLLAAVLSAEAANFGVALAKFGKPASYHSYLAKVWGLVLATAVIAAFASGRSNALIPVALGLGVASNLEGIAMSLMLPVWRKDVKTLRATWRLRQGLGNSMERTMKLAVPATLVLCLLTVPSFAMEPGHAAYAGGSVGVARDTVGALNTTSPTALEFEYRKADGAPGKIEMKYAQIVSIEPMEETAHPLGLLPMIAVALVIHQPHRYLVTLHYVDADSVAQVAVFTVTHRDQGVLIAVVNARTRNCWTGASCRTPLERRQPAEGRAGPVAALQ